jgi:hypothetical protein
MSSSDNTFKTVFEAVPKGKEEYQKYLKEVERNNIFLKMRELRQAKDALRDPTPKKLFGLHAYQNTSPIVPFRD